MSIKVGIIGGSGYTGVELLRILHQHSEAEVIAISSRTLQGKKVAEIFPNMAGLSELIYSLPDDKNLNDCDVIFFATPHGVAMNSAGSFLDKGIKVIDLGADFRIRDADNWSQWYDMKHTQKSLSKRQFMVSQKFQERPLKTLAWLQTPVAIQQQFF